ncbi:MAG: radical SAM protein [archaeon]
MKVIKNTQSLCPGCVEKKKFDSMIIDAFVYEDGGKVWIKKTCPEHGETRELYWGDYEMYKKAQKYHDEKGVKLENPQISKKAQEIICPLECGLCSRHKSHTALANMVITNRCDLSCWYCFFYQKKGDPVYQPTLAELEKMLRVLRNEKPVGCNAIQLTGGEPTIREDVVEVVRLCKRLGFDHVQFNTNAINISKNPELAKRLVSEGANVFYVSFDGMTPQSNPKNYWEFPKALENFRAAKAGVVLVPTVINGVNDDQLGNIIRFAAGNIDVVRAVNFQPVSLVGMMPKEEREKQRITIPDVAKKIEEQTDGEITADDFYSIPCASRITDFIEELRGGPRYRLSSHFACGVGTYVFKDGEKLVPISRFVDVDGFFERIEKVTEELKAGKSKTIAQAKLILSLRKLIDRKAKPKELKFTRILIDAITRGSYASLREFHHKSLFLGMMHFMDPYNYDVERVERCCIHYSLPDGRVIPFCAFNVIPDLYRDKDQAKYSVHPAEWEAATGRKLECDKHKRVIPEGKEAEKIHSFYAKYIKR